MREAGVAGQFYPADRRGLVESIERCFLGEFGPKVMPDARVRDMGLVVGLVAPHAGYIYSGWAAAFAYKALAEDGMPEVAVIIGPNHYGMGAKVALSGDDVWSTPLGNVACDGGLGLEIMDKSKYLKVDSAAHKREHSIEVQLPFLQYLRADISIVPISMAYVSKSEAISITRDLGAAIAENVAGKSAVVIASTDFSHYISRESAVEKDGAVIEHIVKRDPIGVIDEVYDKDVTMCGAVGVAVMLEACNRLGAHSAQKLAYYTSGDVTGDSREVVGYGAVVVSR